MPNSKVYLWEDLGLPVMSYNGEGNLNTTPTTNCSLDAVFINMWLGVFQDKMVP
jgi:hypothetical protein